MAMKKHVLINWLLVFAAISVGAQQNDFPKLRGPYLGQKPPGMTPELFAPHVISTGYHEDGGPAFTPDLSEIYFRIAQYPYAAIFFMREENGSWSTPKTASFSGKYSDGDPFISYDGKRLFFSSYRPLSDKGEPRNDEDIWYVERIDHSWSEPKNLGKPVNSDQPECKPSLSANGNLYFTAKREANQSGWKIYLSKWTGKAYSEPVEFDEEINKAYLPYGPCIAKDETFMIFSSNKEPGRRFDLFVTFRDKKGKWMNPKNLGDLINSAKDELFPILSHDNRYLFYTSWRTDLKNYSDKQKSYEDLKKSYDSPSNGRGGDIYWVSTKIIEELRPAAGASLAQSPEAPEKQARKLSDKLSVLKPFIGPTWTGSIPSDSRMGEITLKWEVLLNGFAVRLSRHALKFDHWLETTYFWDESSQKIAYLALSNNGVVIKGYVAGQGAELISEGDQRGPQVNRKVRRIYRLEKDGKLYEDDLFRNSDADEWRRTHISIFVAK